MSAVENLTHTQENQLNSRAQQSQLHEILESLIADTPQKLSVLRGVVAFAQGLQNRGLGFSWAGDLASEVCRAFDLAAEFPNWLASLPEASKNYFHGLVEALEIYQSIHGRWIAVHSLTSGDTSVQELKQIRELCLQEGLRSIY